MDKILIIGRGGREDALEWKIAQSSDVSKVFRTKKENFSDLGKLVKDKKIDAVIVGPETPLVEGIVDYFNERGYNKIFGPTSEGARLESDKFYSYDLMEELGISQAESVKCFTQEEAIREINLRTNENGIVIKARGLKAGKGVGVYNSKEEAIADLKLHSEKYGQEVLIAERLFGQEFSVFGISDGKKVLPFEIAVQDHKRLLDGDLGPNTGGMGAYCPVSFVSRELIKKITDEIISPVVRKINYKGFIYAGMIMTEQGPKVIEFNARLGDPECQPLMIMIKSDFYKLISLALGGRLNEAQIEFNSGAACCVVLASQGYPDSELIKKGLPITGIEEAEKINGVKVFHAGTKFVDGKIITDGGRVLNVTAYSPNGILEARDLVYEAVSKINISGGFQFRKDIAHYAIEK